MKTNGETLNAIHDYTLQFTDGLITEPEWLTKTVDTLMQRDRYLKEQAATTLYTFLEGPLHYPMSSPELKSAITEWMTVNYYLFKPTT
jgi:hypothetical protein